MSDDGEYKYDPPRPTLTQRLAERAKVADEAPLTSKSLGQNLRAFVESEVAKYTALGKDTDFAASKLPELIQALKLVEKLDQDPSETAKVDLSRLTPAEQVTFEALVCKLTGEPAPRVYPSAEEKAQAEHAASTDIVRALVNILGVDIRTAKDLWTHSPRFARGALHA